MNMSGRATQNGFNESEIPAVCINGSTDDRLLERFAATNHDSIFPLRYTIQNFRGARDLLIPRLLNGTPPIMASCI